MKTVFVGLSGGVDSSVAALRLKRAGYNVVGVFIKVWHPEFLVCNWEEERLDAMRVAAHLDIPFLTCDAEEAYREQVGEYFIREYTEGRTPNPDVMCNKAVKFGAFIDFAKAHGADHIATGHYARKVGANLLRGKDANKDQSYFLWTLTKEQLAYALFPVGDTDKAAIRAEAASAGIPTAIKKDSQGICFLGHVDIAEFISHFTNVEKGPVLDLHGTVIGEHEGALVYTIGQRHGFQVTSRDAARTPQYVVAKNIEKNTITVAPHPPQLSTGDTITLTHTNWIGEAPSAGTVYEAQFRYRQKPLALIVVSTEAGGAVLKMTETGEQPAVGQSCVLYTGDQCHGGGIIASI